MACRKSPHRKISDLIIPVDFACCVKFSSELFDQAGFKERPSKNFDGLNTTGGGVCFILRLRNLHRNILRHTLHTLHIHRILRHIPYHLHRLRILLRRTRRHHKEYFR